MSDDSVRSFCRRTLSVTGIFVAFFTTTVLPDRSAGGVRSWDAGGNGTSWEDNCNWSGPEDHGICFGFQPFDGDDVIIPFGNPVVSFPEGIASLLVNPSARVDLNGPLTAHMGVTNESVITITGGLGIGEFNPDDTLLQGGGEVILANSNFLNPARLNGASFVSSHVTHAAGNTIRGEGGVNGRWINDGLIRAEETSGDLSAILAIGGTMTNNGVIRSSATGMIRLENATLAMGATGQFIADGQPIQLNASTISGGSIDAINGGKLVHAGAGTALLSGVTINSDFDVLVNNASVHAAGSGITNNGTMTFDNIGLQSHLSVESGATIGGTGTVILNSESDGNNGVRIIGGPFTHGANHTIRGVGVIRANFVNNGTILAEPRNGTLLRIAVQGTNFNNGLIQANTGATLRIDSESSVTQGGAGRIRAVDGARIEMPNTTVIGGHMETVGSGLIVATGATLTDVTNSGLIHVPASFDILRLAGSSFTNHGEVVVNPSGGAISVPPTVRFQTDMTLEGTGLILLNQSPSGARMETWEANKVVTQAAGHTIRGNGLMTWGTYINHGRLEGISAAEPLVITANLGGDGTLKDIFFIGQHTLADAGTTAIVPVEGSYEMGNGGRLLVDIGGTTPGIGYDQLNGNGPMTISPSFVTRLEASILPGFVPAAGDMFKVMTTTDTLTGTFANAILPTNIPNHALTWKPVQYTGSDVIIEVLSVSPMPGDFDGNGLYQCADIDALVSAIVGVGNPALFDITSDGLVNPADLTFWLTVAGAENLASANPYLPGDANLDGAVDETDFGIWNANMFSAAAGWCSGDFNADGAVDGSDFGVWNEHKFASSAANIAVPEPSALIALLASGGMIAVTRRRIWRICPTCA